MKKILVPVDGSKNSKKAIMKAIDLGKKFDSEIVVLNVVNDIIAHPYLSNQDYGMKTNEGLVELGKGILKDALEVLEDYPGKVDSKLRYGDSGRGILEEIEENKYDLIVMGSRGLGAFSRFMLGSVSNKVLHHSEVDVLIVKCPKC